jgi:hypothetical protein
MDYAGFEQFGYCRIPKIVAFREKKTFDKVFAHTLHAIDSHVLLLFGPHIEMQSDVFTGRGILVKRQICSVTKVSSVSGDECCSACRIASGQRIRIQFIRENNFREFSAFVYSTSRGIEDDAGNSIVLGDEVANFVRDSESKSTLKVYQ